MFEKCLSKRKKKRETGHCLSLLNTPFLILSLLCLLASQEKAMAPHSSTLAWKIPWTEEPGRQQSMGWGESDMTEWLHFHFSLSCIGEGNGNPLQCSCLGNPGDGGAWWAVVYGVAQSRTWLKRLSNSSSSSFSRLRCPEWFLSLPNSLIVTGGRIMLLVESEYCKLEHSLNIFISLKSLVSKDKVSTAFIS